MARNAKHPSYVSRPSVCPPQRSICSGPLPIFKLGLSFWSGVVWVLYIFWRSNPCLRYHLQICLPMWLVPFLFCWFFLAVQKLFILKSHLFILSFMSFALGDISVKILLHGKSEIFLPMFSSRTFMVSQLIFMTNYINCLMELVAEVYFCL